MFDFPLSQLILPNQFGSVSHIMSDILPPKSYHEKVAPLAEKQFPYGVDCKLAREVQALAFHHGLSQANVDALVKLEFDSVLSFSNADPNGDEEQRGVFRLSLGVFDSPVTRRKMAFVIRRLCSPVPFAEVPRDFDVSMEPRAKKPKLSRSVDVAAPALAVAAGGGASAAPAAEGAGASVPASTSTASKDGVSATSAKKVPVDYDSSDDSSESDDSDDDDDVDKDKEEKKEEKKDEEGADKKSKSDKMPKNANSMVVELDSPVSFLWLVPLCACVFSSLLKGREAWA